MSGFFLDFLKRLLIPPTKAGPEQKQSAAPPGRQPKEMTPERAELIAKAMAIHREKQALLAELSDTQREALTYMALKAFFGAKVTDTPPAPKKPSGKST